MLERATAQLKFYFILNLYHTERYTETDPKVWHPRHFQIVLAHEHNKDHYHLDTGSGEKVLANRYGFSVFLKEVTKVTE